ncbi:MAG TPA: hypothetical protein VFV02_05045 [Acidimicrobiales bacterium]|nr:hypothetical protein [Acidimicrobiales bacterium]
MTLENAQRPKSFDEAERLVSLREFMEEGIRRSSDRSAIGRRAAIVILDGAVEAAMGACLDKYGDDWGERLEDGYSKLVSHLRDSGGSPTRISAWPEVRRLRRARNNAQHHGVTPDADDLTRWSGAVLTFVESVIFATFKLELSLVCLADALATEELRGEFRIAEQRLAEGDTMGTISQLALVFSEARRRWDNEHRSAHPVSFFVPAFGQQHDQSVAYIEDVLSVATFASDLGEYVWWQSVANAAGIHPQSTSVSQLEARRAMSFVFNWILRWEAFSATYSADRLGRIPSEAPPPSPYPDGRPTLLLGPITVTAQSANPVRYLANVRLSAGSEGVPWPTWRHHLQSAFSDQRSHPWEFAFIRDDGAVELEVDPNVDRNGLVRALESVLARAVEHKEEADLETSATQALAEASEPLRAALLEVRTPNGDLLFEHVDVRVQVQQDPERRVNLMLEARFTPRWHFAAVDRITDGAPAVTGVGNFHGVGIDFPAATDIAVALSFVKECLDALRAYKDSRRSVEAQVEETRSMIEALLNP